MPPSIDLTRFADEDDDDGSLVAKSKSSSKRSEWAQGKTRALPSENWDDDFLFGSASTESLPLPSKAQDAGLHSQGRSSYKKPGSSHSIAPPSHHHPPSRSNRHQQASSSRQHPPAPHPPRRITPSAIHTEPDCDPSLPPPDHDSTTSTPRKRSSKPPISRPTGFPSSLSSHPSRDSSLPTLSSLSPSMSYSQPLATSSSRSSAVRVKPGPFRPPSSAPASRGASAEGSALYRISLDHRRVSDHDHPSKSSSTQPANSSTSAVHLSRPPISVRRPTASHKAVSSQDSVPSISDLSSAGFRSPSSSLSMTDESRCDWSRSSGDYSATFGGSGKGNLSFKTETEFTEPDTELDWGDDTDHDNRSSCSVVYKPLAHKSESKRTLPHNAALTQIELLSPHLSLSAHPPHPSSSITNVTRPHRATNPAEVMSALLSPPSVTQTAQSAVESIYPPPPQESQIRKSTHSSFDSQSTFTSVHSRKTKKTHPSLPSDCPPAVSSSSSIEYFKSNHSDASLHSPALGYQLDQLQQALVKRPPQPRAGSLSSTCSSDAPIPYQSGSDSYDAATSGTETDGLSDNHQAPNSRSLYSSVGKTPSSNGFTPTGTQRSRKQALYARPSYVDMSSSVSSLSASIRSSTSNTSIIYAPNPPPQEGTRPSEDDQKSAKSSSNLRKKFRRRRPSVLALNSTGTHPPSSGMDSPITKYFTGPGAVGRQGSTCDSSFTSESAQSGDLPFAVDSEDDERVQKRRAKAGRSTSPFELVEKPNQPEMSVTSAPSAVRSGFRPPSLSLRARSAIPKGEPLRHRNHSDKDDDSTVADNVSKKFKPRRPLSFTALLSRTSIASLPIVSAAMSSNGSTSGTAHFPNAQSRGGSDPSQKPSRMRLGHRHTASIGSNPIIYNTGQYTSYSTSPIQEPSQGFLARVRRLSSRPASAKATPPVSPKKRYSLTTGVVASSTSDTRAPPSTILGSRQPSISDTSRTSSEIVFSPPILTQRSSISQSQSVASEMTVKAANHPTLRGRRSSSRTSPGHVSPMSQLGNSFGLIRKFSIKSNNKSSVYQPDVCRTSADLIDHDLSTAAPQAESHPPLRRTFSSRPPKSNPALRRKASSSVNSSFLDYQVESHLLAPPRDEGAPTQISPLTTEFRPMSGLPPANRLNLIRQQSQRETPNSEPMPDRASLSPTESPNTTQSSISAGQNVPLPRCNSMGELRIPSRITSQQGRLQTELNQVKEFARGIEELKAMRKSYRKMIQATHRLHSSIPPCPEFSDRDSSSSDDGAEEPRELPSSEAAGRVNIECDDSSDQVSPTALNKLYSVIHRIQEEYKEWWTCCNVLIDLGEGTTDPRTKFSPERIRAISCYPTSNSKPPSLSSPQQRRTANQVPVEVGQPVARKHYEILRSMFGPGGEANVAPASSSSTSTGNQEEEMSSHDELSSCEGAKSLIGPSTRRQQAQTPPRILRPARSTASLEDQSPISKSSLTGSCSTVIINPETPTPPSRQLLPIQVATKQSETKATQHASVSTGNDPLNLKKWSEIETSLEDEDQLDGELMSLKQSSGVGTEESILFNPLLPAELASPSANPLPSVSSVATRQGDMPSAIQLKRKANLRHSSYQQQNLTGRPGDGNPTRGRLSAGSRIGINGIKDFLKLLKARVHAEEKWSIRSKLNNTARGSIGEGRAKAEAAQNQTSSNLGEATIDGEVMKSSESEDDRRIPKAMTMMKTPERKPKRGGAGSENLSMISTSSPSSSSEEECWDEMIGEEITRRTTDSLDLAGTVVRKGIGEGRLALSSERMPQLLNYLSIVKEQCKECLEELKSQTV